MTTMRAHHTATLLPDGKVLVTGGTGGPVLASAELYEPATETWTPTGSMTTERSGHTATLLPNGKVLVTGGFGALASTELYDPATGMWMPTGSMTTGRTQHTATPLPSGKVLVAGGEDGFQQAFSSAELYEPVTGLWTSTGSMTTARANHTATLLPNGKVLVAAGYRDSYYSAVSTAELYDPASGIWVTTGSLTAARFAHTAILLPDGNVLVAGGSTPSSAELYDPSLGIWMTTGSLTNGHTYHTATLLPSGYVLAAAGGNSSAELYGPLPVADLSITKTNGQTTASPGQTVTYTMSGTNAGPTAAHGATVTDTVPAALAGATWTCVAAGGATCTAGPIGGNINDTVDLPVGGTVTYTLTGQVAANAKSLSNTATIALPPHMFDPNTSDNTATDTDLVICNAEKVVIPDGRLATDTIAAAATQWFGAGLKIGDSYSLEVKNAELDTPVSNVAPGALTAYSGDDGCSGTSTLAVTDTTPNDPAGTGASVRVSFTASGTSSFFRAKLANGSPGPILYTVSWSDTTLYSSAWSTNANFDTYYSVANTTGSTLSGVLILFDSSGSIMGSSYMTIPAGQKGSTNTVALGIARTRKGFARFTHDGPPGAAIIEAAIASFSLNPAYVQRVKFETVREAR